MKNNRKRFLALVAIALVMLCVLTACGGSDEEDELPEEVLDTTLVPNAYFVGSESLIAVQPEAGVKLMQLNVTETGAFEYQYAGFSAVNTSVQSYVETLVLAENGFSVVDGETFRATAAPDFTQPEGTVSLSKPAENEKITVIRLDWTGDQCTASISIEDAPVIEPPKANNNKNNSYGLSHTGAVDFLKELSPSVLELEGESMEIYNIYIMNGFTYVNGEACLRVKIYSDDNEMQTNTHMGTYFLSGNGEHIYRLSEDGLALELEQ